MKYTGNCKGHSYSFGNLKTLLAKTAASETVRNFLNLLLDKSRISAVATSSGVLLARTFAARARSSSSGASLRIGSSSIRCWSRATSPPDARSTSASTRPGTSWPSRWTVARPGG